MGSRMLRRRPIVLACLVALAGSLAVLVPADAGTAPHGSVHQVGGTNGCYTMFGDSPDGTGTCTNIRGPGQATSIAISPDGKFAYTIGYPLGSYKAILGVFKRDTTTGVLTQKGGLAGCWSIDGSSEAGPGTCSNARDLTTGDGHSIAISANGTSLYVASQFNGIGGLVVFHRNPNTGALDQFPGKTGCFTANGGSEQGPGTCTQARETDAGSSVEISPDQKYVYLTNYDGQPHSGIAVFRRAKDGSLTQLSGDDGCITYNGTTGQTTRHVCREAKTLGQTFEIAVPDNRFVYAADRTDNLVAAFKRNAAGGLVPLSGKGGCISNSGNSPIGPGSCRQGRGLDDVERLVVSANGHFLYTAGFTPMSVAVLNRNPTSGVLSERASKAACYTPNGKSHHVVGLCRIGRALKGGYAGSLAPDGRTLYFASQLEDGFVIFRTNPRTGAFVQLSGLYGCVTEDGSSSDGPHTCGNGRAVLQANEVTVGPGGRDVYVVSQDDTSPYTKANGVSLFHAVTR